MEILHQGNIIIHVMAASIGLLTGIGALMVTKRRGKHTQFGRYFMYAMIIVTATGLAGVFIFNRNMFLLVLTLTAGYNCFSGIRVLRRLGKPLAMLDYVVPLLVLALTGGYLHYIQQSGVYWSPVIIYSGLAYLVLVTVYDLSRGLLPVATLKRAAIYEHVYKMMSALSALLSAFGGTMLPQFKPYSQFMPSVIGLTCVIVIFIRLGGRKLSFQRKPVLQTH
ncbi:hypothetical protein [Chitinophaga agri]|uniref:DUF2306 domain-containing protein n=1 Tax=Chitinophaga agri TaxID=2703787 RepID=A0A6B9ZEZ1_9BACT|nr:hypothetical protein [Chitinophaga agri]QHS59725.1 hypothetical protein GWR21_09010 [Chitinophaga agri]